MIVVALLLVGALGAGTFSYVFAKGLESQIGTDFQSGQAQLVAGRTLLKQASSGYQSTLIQGAKANFAAAHKDFQAVSANARYRRVDQAGSVPILGLPIAGRVTAIRNLASMGADLANAGTHSADVEQILLGGSAVAAPGQGATRLLGLMTAAAPGVGLVNSDFLAAKRAALAVDPSVLPAQYRGLVGSAIRSIEKGIAGLGAFTSLVPVLTEVLGGNGNRVYLIEQTNPAELRAGGGYIGTYSLVGADHGALTVERSGDTHDLPDYKVQKGQPGYVAPPPTMTEFVAKRSWNLGDSNFYPDFASNALAAEQFAQRDFGHPVDGVISIDLDAVAGILQVVGPMKLPGYNVTLTSTNLVNQAVMLEIEDPNHKAVLDSLSGLLMARIATLSVTQWPQLLSEMNTLVTQRHIQVYLNNAEANNEVARAGWSGKLDVTGAQDWFMPVETNFGGNKSNYFLTRTYDLTLTRSGATLHHRLEVSLVLNRSVVTIYNAFYRAYFRLYVPGSATGLSITGAGADVYPNTAVPPGTKLIDGWAQLNPTVRGRTGTLQIAYQWDTPWKTNSTTGESLYWQKQPGTSADQATIHWSNGSAVSASSDLSVDRILLLHPDSLTVEAAPAAGLHLPGISV